MSARVPSESTFQVGASTGRAIATWIVTLPKTAVLAIVALSPLFAWNFLSGAYADDDPVVRGPMLQLADKLLEALLGSVLSGMVIHVAFKRLMREPGSIGVAIGAGFSRAVPLIGAGLVQGAITLLPIGAMLAVTLLGDDTDLLSAPNPLLGLVGIVAVVMAAIVTAMFAATAGSVVIESKGPIDALKRSLELTKGFRFKIFVCSILVGIITFVVAMVTAMVGAVAFSGSAATIGIIAAVVATPLSATLSAVVYHDLRLTKEGVDVNVLMKVFA